MHICPQTHAEGRGVCKGKVVTKRWMGLSSQKNVDFFLYTERGIFEIYLRVLLFIYFDSKKFKRKNWKSDPWARERTKQVKVFAASPSHLSGIPGKCVVGERTPRAHCLFTATRAPWHLPPSRELPHCETKSSHTLVSKKRLRLLIYWRTWELITKKLFIWEKGTVLQEVNDCTFKLQKEKNKKKIS